MKFCLGLEFYLCLFCRRFSRIFLFSPMIFHPTFLIFRHYSSFSTNIQPVKYSHGEWCIFHCGGSKKCLMSLPVDWSSLWKWLESKWVSSKRRPVHAAVSSLSFYGARRSRATSAATKVSKVLCAVHIFLIAAVGGRKKNTDDEDTNRFKSNWRQTTWPSIFQEKRLSPRNETYLGRWCGRGGSKTSTVHPCRRRDTVSTPNAGVQRLTVFSQWRCAAWPWLWVRRRTASPQLVFRPPPPMYRCGVAG